MDIAYLKTRLSYDSLTGEFRWRFYEQQRLTWNSAHAGKIAGSIHRNGYLVIRVDGKAYLAHRLAYAFMMGRPAAEQVDHADCNKLNNAWSNLRAATPSENMANHGAKKGNASGIKGVRWHPRDKCWYAAIRVNYKQIHLGAFASSDAARQAYQAAAISYFGDFARVS